MLKAYFLVGFFMAKLTARFIAKPSSKHENKKDNPSVFDS